MTKEHIVNRIWDNLDITRTEAAEAVDILIDTLKTCLKEEEKLKFGGFGVFEVRHRKARMGRNPKTGKPAEIKEGKTIKFKPGKPLKMAVLEK